MILKDFGLILFLKTCQIFGVEIEIYSHVRDFYAFLLLPEWKYYSFPCEEN